MKGIELILSALKLNPTIRKLISTLVLLTKIRTRGGCNLLLSKGGIGAKTRLSGVYNNLAVVLPELDRFDEGIGCLMKALELRPDYAQAHYNLGNLVCQSAAIRGCHCLL